MDIDQPTLKTAKPDYPIHELLAQRWSPRAFAGTPVEAGKLCSILEAARWSASSGNGQPWFFLIATQETPAAYADMTACLMEGNLPWASKAPVLGMVVTTNVRANGKPNRHAFYDAGLAMQNVCVQATALGLHLRQMGGFHPEEARTRFHLPETHEAVAMFALGYLGNPDDLSENHRAQEIAARQRRPLNEFVFTGDWDTPAPFLGA